MPAPSGGEPGGGEPGGHERFDDLMRASIDSHRWAIQNLYGKAKSILTAGTIVLGIVMGGLGTVGGLVGEGALATWEFLRAQNGCAAGLIVACSAGSLAAIFLSVLFAVLAIRVRRISGFGRASIFMSGDEVNEEAVDRWVSASDEKVYKKTHKAYVKELHSLEAQNRDMGRYAGWSQISLCAGIALSAAGAIAFLAVVATS